MPRPWNKQSGFADSEQDRHPLPGFGWQLVYTGFILILLCFFIMLSSLATLESSKMTRFVHAFNRALSIFTGGTKLEPGDLILPESVDMVDREAELARLYGELRQVIALLGDAAPMEVELTAEGVRLRVTAPVLFESGQADLLPEARPLLARLAGLVAGTALLIRIEGHTDTLPIRTPRYPSNWELSTARAVQVLRYLTEEAGFPVSRLSAAGRGPYHPLESNATEAGRQRNRRVEILFHVS